MKKFCANLLDSTAETINYEKSNAASDKEREKRIQKRKILSHM